MKNIHILGAGVRAGLAIESIQTFCRDKYRIVGLYDDEKRGVAHGKAILGRVFDAVGLISHEDSAFVAFGTYASIKTLSVVDKLQQRGVEIANLVSPRANISDSAKYDVNAMILAGAFIGKDVTMGVNFTAHGNCAVEHNSVVGDNVLLGPGVAMAGFVKIGSHCLIGAGVAIAPAVSIGEGVLLGAGSVVIKDIPSHVVAYGNPARPVRPTNAKDEVPTIEDIQAYLRTIR